MVRKRVQWSDEAKAKMVEKVRQAAKERWSNLSFEEVNEAKRKISEAMKKRHRQRTPQERRNIALKAAKTRLEKQKKGGKRG